LELDRDELKAILRKVREAAQRFTQEIAEAEKLLAAAPSVAPEIALSEKFPPELREHLRFFNEEGYVRVEPKHYLGKMLFAQIATVARELGGEYVSAGRDSHFRFKRERGIDEANINR